MTAQHTPTPWYCVKQNPMMIRSLTDKCEVARASEVFMDKAQRHANAAFIVQACNAHDALVEALQKVADGCDDAQDFAIAQLRNLGLGSVK